MTTEMTVQNLKINKLTKAQYDTIAPSATEAYELTDLSSILDTIPDTAQLSYYGTCSTAAATQAKVVVCEGFTLKEGVSIRVKFTNAQSYNGAPTLNVNSTGAKSVKSVGTTNSLRYCWFAGEVVSFTYDGTNWIMEDGGIASTTYYGYTKLSSSATSTSTAIALTPASLNSLVQNMIEPYPIYSATVTYAVGDKVRYNYQAWECITAITTAEAWTADHWTALDPIQTQLDNKQDTITSTNKLSADLLSEGTTNKLVSASEKSTWNGKQNALVSGTNIKTVNNTSLLGSGNVAVQPTLVSGTNIKTINNTSLLGSGNIEIQGGADVEAYTASEVQALWSSI